MSYAVVDGDRIDNLAAKYLGDPMLYWMICDANGVTDPGLADGTGRPHHPDSDRLGHSGERAQWLADCTSRSWWARSKRCRHPSR